MMRHFGLLLGLFKRENLHEGPRSFADKHSMLCNAKRDDTLLVGLRSLECRVMAARKTEGVRCSKKQIKHSCI
jgi:hypothetical protein